MANAHSNHSCSYFISFERAIKAGGYASGCNIILNKIREDGYHIMHVSSSKDAYQYIIFADTEEELTIFKLKYV